MQQQVHFDLAIAQLAPKRPKITWDMGRFHPKYALFQLPIMFVLGFVNVLVSLNRWGINLVSSQTPSLMLLVLSIFGYSFLVVRSGKLSSLRKSNLKINEVLQDLLKVLAHPSLTATAGVMLGVIWFME